MSYSRGIRSSHNNNLTHNVITVDDSSAGGGHVEIIDLGDPSLNQEIEVVTVETTEGELTPKMIQLIRRSPSSNRRKSSSSSSSINSNLISLTSTNSPGRLSQQQPGGSLFRVNSSKPPALLRNSRRFIQTQEVVHTPSPSLYLNQQRGGNLNTYSNSQASGTSSSGSFAFRSEPPDDDDDHEQQQPMIIHNQEFQEAVLLDEQGQPTDQIVFLAANESGEMQVIERSELTLHPESAEYPSSSSSASQMSLEKAVGGEIHNFTHAGQTIIICQDPETNQESQYIEDEDGNLIPIESDSGLTYHQVNFSIENEDESNLGINEGQSSEQHQQSHLPHSAKSKKKSSKKPLQVLIGPDGKPIKKKGQPELQCMEKGCPTICYNVFELRKHLTLSHSIHIDEEVVNFPSDKAFKEWRENYERERMVSFIFRGGTKKLAKDQAVTYLICHRSGHYKPTMNNESLRKRKLKPQGSCKMGGYCTAGMKLLKNLESGNIKMEICHTHYGHPLDSEAIPHLRVNPTLRKVILNKFREGLTFIQVLAYIHHNPDRLEGLRLVDRRAVRNIFDAWKDPSKRSKKAQQDIDEINTTSPGPPSDEEEALHSEETDEQATNTKTDNLQPSTSDSPVDSNLTTESQLESSETASEQIEISNVDTSSSSSSSPVKTSKSNDDGITESISQTSQPTEKNSTQLEPELIIETEGASSTGSYRLRPNRRVEVYKTTSKPKVSSSEPSSSISTAETSEPQHTKPADLPPVPKPRGPEPVSLSPSLESSLEKLNNHGESGPTVLFYKKYGSLLPSIGSSSKKDLKREDFCVILQSPVQRQLLQMFPSIIGLELLDSPRPDSPLKLSFLVVLDEYREAIPVAWLITNSFFPRIFHNFLRTIRSQCGDLKTEYLMAPTALENVTKLWTSSFGKKPRLLLNELDFRRDVKALISYTLGNDKMRREMWDLVESLSNESRLEEVEKFLAKTGQPYESYCSITSNYLPFRKAFESQWLDNIRQWALCYRLNTSVNVIGVFQAFNRLKKFIGFKGTKNLNESFEHILKIGYDKCFLRSKRMFKGDQKFSKIVEEIKQRHNVARQLRNGNRAEIRREEGSASITCKVDSKEFNVTEVKSKCGCKLVCGGCGGICSHSYLCSCRDYSTSQVMCEHIHLAHMMSNGIAEDETDCHSQPADECHVQNLSESDGGVFGKVPTFGSAEAPGQFINIDAVLKAAGIFHRADGLQPQQIVSITDADTQDVLYEHHHQAATESQKDETETITLTEDDDDNDTPGDRNCSGENEKTDSLSIATSPLAVDEKQTAQLDNSKDSQEQSPQRSELCNKELSSSDEEDYETNEKLTRDNETKVSKPKERITRAKQEPQTGSQLQMTRRSARRNLQHESHEVQIVVDSPRKHQLRKRRQQQEEVTTNEPKRRLRGSNK